MKAYRSSTPHVYITAPSSVLTILNENFNITVTTINTEEQASRLPPTLLYLITQADHSITYYSSGYYREITIAEAKQLFRIIQFTDTTNLHNGKSDKIRFYHSIVNLDDDKYYAIRIVADRHLYNMAKVDKSSKAQISLSGNFIALSSAEG